MDPPGAASAFACPRASRGICVIVTRPGPEVGAHLSRGVRSAVSWGDIPSGIGEHITKAAHDFKAEHYMGDVARVHLKLRSKS